MYSLADIIYYLLLALCIFLSFIDEHKLIRGIVFLRVLLVTAFFVELANQFILTQLNHRNIIYHFYIPIENGMLCLFYSKTLKKKFLKQGLYFFAIFYVATFFLHSFTFGNFDSYPGLFYNIHCLLIIILATIGLINLKVIENLSIVKNPMFWLNSTFLLFYSGIFFFNGTYNYFIRHDVMIANSLRSIINLNLNLLLYLLWAYSLYLSIQMKKFYLPQSWE